MLRAEREKPVTEGGSRATWSVLRERVDWSDAAARLRVVTADCDHGPRCPRRLPHQITLIARCLAEASALRTARRLQSGADAVVILTAG